MIAEYISPVETSDVRRHVTETIERAKRAAAERRSLNADATREYATFLERIATPLFRQVAGVLKAESYPFTVFTPSGSLRLMSDKSADDFIELALDTTRDRPAVMIHASRARGSRVIDLERPVSDGPVSEITEDQLLRVILEELAPLVER